MGFLKRLLGGAMGGHHSGGQQGGGHHRSYWPNPNYDSPTTTNRSEAPSCPNCKAGNSYNAKFCQQCGTSLAPLTCTQCNASLLPDAKFCPQCGKART